MIDFTPTMYQRNKDFRNILKSNSLSLSDSSGIYKGIYIYIVLETES